MFFELNRDSMSWFDFRKVFRSERSSWRKQENNVETVSVVVKAEKYNETREYTRLPSNGVKLTSHLNMDPFVFHTILFQSNKFTASTFLYLHI